MGRVKCCRLREAVMEEGEGRRGEGMFYRLGKGKGGWRFREGDLCW